MGFIDKNLMLYVKNNFTVAGDLPALPTRGELEIQMSRQEAQISNESTMNQPEQSTMMEPIDPENVADDHVVDISTDIHFDCE